MQLKTIAKARSFVQQWAKANGVIVDVYHPRVSAYDQQDKSRIDYGSVEVDIRLADVRRAVKISSTQQSAAWDSEILAELMQDALMIIKDDWKRKAGNGYAPR